MSIIYALAQHTFMASATPARWEGSGKNWLFSNASLKMYFLFIFNHQSQLYLLWRLGSFGAQGALLKTFDDSVVASSCRERGLTSWSGRQALCWGVERRIVVKLSAIMDNPTHRSPWEPWAAPSVTDCSTHSAWRNATTGNFIPTAARLYNRRVLYVWIMSGTFTSTMSIYFPCTLHPQCG